MKTGFLGLALAGALFFAGCSSKDTPQAPQNTAKTDGPALWLVQDADTKIYMFGTVHLLKPETEWRTPRFDRVLEEADIIYQEADMSDQVQMDLMKVLPTLAFYADGTTLRGTLDEEDEKEVQEAADILDLDLAGFDRMKPWFAAVALTQSQMAKDGFDVSKGVDAIITAEAQTRNKKIRHFETAEQQLRFMAELPETSQIDFLVASAEAIEDQPDMLSELVDDWAVGDLAGIEEALADPETFGDIIVYDRLLTNRNKAWTDEITDLLDEETGTILVAVGAAHLAGRDSVIKMLQAEGETVTRQ